MTAPENPYVAQTQEVAEEKPEVTQFRQAGRTIPLRTRIILLVVGIAGLGLLVNAVAVSSLMREVSYSRMDQDLETAMSSWARTVEILNIDGRQGPPSDYYVAKIFIDGSNIIFNDAQSAPDLAETAIGTGPHTVAAVPGSSSPTPWRVMAVKNGDVITVVGKSMGRETTLIYRLVVVQMIIGVLILVAILISYLFLVRQSLRPLREVEETAKSIAGGDLDRRGRPVGQCTQHHAGTTPGVHSQRPGEGSPDEALCGGCLP